MFKKKIYSEIVLSERQINEVKRGNEASFYFPVYIRAPEKHIYALFTQAEIDRAIARAVKHPESKKYEQKDYWLSRLIKFVLW